MLMSEIIEFCVLGSCFLLSGIFSGVEAAIISISFDRAKQMIEEGGKTGKAMIFLTRDPNMILTTILIGNNIVNILAASLATVITQRFFSGAVAISTGVTTFLILIFGEILPKTHARNNAERLIVPIYRFLRVNTIVLFPIIKITTVIVRLFLGKNAKITGRVVTSNDIEFMVNKAEKEKTINSKQIDLLSSILEFPSIKVKDIMIPRKEVVYLQNDYGFRSIIEKIREAGFSRYPVIGVDLDDTIGFLHVKDLAFVPEEKEAGQRFDVTKYLKSPFFVYEHMRIQAVFDHMNRKKNHLALVKDETGMVVGIITLEDIMEEIFGEIVDEHDDEEVEIEDSFTEEGLLLDSDITLRDLDTDYNLEIPLNDNYSTLNGFLLDMLGNDFPQKDQIIYWEGYRFKLEGVVDQTIETVRITHADGDKHLFPNKSEEEEEDSSSSEPDPVKA